MNNCVKGTTAGFFIISTFCALLGFAACSCRAGSAERSELFGLHITTTVPRRAGPRLRDAPQGVDTPKAISDAGATWVRYDRLVIWDLIERAKGKYDWSGVDPIVDDTLDNGVDIAMTMIPFNKLDGGKMDFAPKDTRWYGSFLKELVERYDGDGVDDARGSPVVEYWQVGNEIDHPAYFNDTPENYADLLKVSYRNIKAANPKAKVILGAMAAPKGMKYHSRVLKRLGKNRRYFDVFDFHWFANGGDTYRRHALDDVAFVDYIDQVKAMLDEYGYDDVPLWMMETGVHTGQPRGTKKPLRFISEQEQASDLVKIHLYAFAHGVSKIFWTSLTELNNFGGHGGYFDTVGLIHNPKNRGMKHKKLSYFTYWKLCAMLKDCGPGDIKKVREEDGVFLYKCRDVYVGWCEGGQEQSVDIPGKKATIIKAVPRHKSGKSVRNAETAFSVASVAAEDGLISCSLSSTPVYIVPQPGE